MLAGPVSNAIRGGLPGRQNRQVGDATEVEQHARLGVAAEHRSVDVGRQRGALPAEGHVASSKVRDYRRMEPGGKRGRASELERRTGGRACAVLRIRDVLHRLAVGANEVEVGCRQPGGVERLLSDIGEVMREAHVELAHEAYVRGRGLHAQANHCPQLVGVGRAGEPERLNLNRLPRSIQANNGRVHAIERGPTHQPEDDAWAGLDELENRMGHRQLALSRISAARSRWVSA